MAHFKGWGWYASLDGENYTEGPELTRDAIIDLARGEGFGNEEENDDGSWTITFTIIEARKEDIEIADYFDVDLWIEGLENGSFYDLSNGDVSIVDHVTPKQRDLLGIYVKDAMRRWQNSEQIRIEPWRFDAARNEETITYILPKKEV